MKTIDEKIVFDDQLVVEKARLKSGSEEFTRSRLNRPDAAAVVIFNTDSNKIILAKQYRYAIAAKTPEPILEIVAGKIDQGESPSEAAVRETEEESGYRISADRLGLLATCFASPGYSSEQFYIYYAAVNDRDKVSAGGGLESENEHIELVELELEKFRDMINNGLICDAKTYVAGLLLFSNKH